MHSSYQAHKINVQYWGYVRLLMYHFSTYSMDLN